MEDLLKQWEQEAERRGGFPVTDEQRQAEAHQAQPGLQFDDVLDLASLDFDEDDLSHCVVEMTNGTYVGQLDRQGRPHGTGRLINDEAHTEYLGEWSEGRRHGWGKLTQPNGDVFEGQWDRGVFSGEGRLSQSDGGVYDGLWQWSRPFGEGRYVAADGTVFEGVWGNEEDFTDPFAQPPDAETSTRSVIAGDGAGNGENNNKNSESSDTDVPLSEVGMGTILYPTKARYKGEWRGLRPHGFGTLRMEDDSEYKGDFENGLFHGWGRLRYANRAEYDGEWKNGRRQGNGRMVSPDGKVEVGHWKRDQLIELHQDQEDYINATKNYLMPDRQESPLAARGADVVGPAEPRGRWAGRRSGSKASAFGPFADDEEDEAELDEDEEEDVEEAEEVEQHIARPRRNEGITQGHRTSSNHTRWEPLKGIRRSGRG